MHGVRLFGSLEWLLRGGDHQEVIQLQRIDGILCDEQMANVGRVKTAAKQADTHGRGVVN
jgi:hypothetical protein